MNKTLVGLVLIALLIGLGGGYVLGYAIYQPQLQNLRNDLNNVSDDLDNLSNDLDNAQSSDTTLKTRLDTINSSLTNAQLSLTTLQNQLNSLLNQLNTLENQLTSLNSKLASLNSTVEKIENRSWHQVWASSGSTNVTSGYFQLKGRTFHIAWGYNALYADSWIETILWFQNGTAYWINGSSGIYSAIDSEGPIVQVGVYYLTITVSSNVEWVVYIEDFY